MMASLERCSLVLASLLFLTFFTSHGLAAIPGYIPGLDYIEILKTPKNEDTPLPAEMRQKELPSENNIRRNAIESEVNGKNKGSDINADTQLLQNFENDGTMFEDFDYETLSESNSDKEHGRKKLRMLSGTVARIQKPDASIQYVKAVRIPDNMRSKFRGRSRVRKYDQDQSESKTNYDKVSNYDEVSNSDHNRVGRNRRYNKLFPSSFSHSSGAMRQNDRKKKDSPYKNITPVGNLYRPRNRYHTRPDASLSSVEVTTFRPTIRYPPISIPISRNPLFDNSVNKRKKKNIGFPSARSFASAPTTSFGILNHNLAEANNGRRKYRERSKMRYLSDPFNAISDRSDGRAQISHITDTSSKRRTFSSSHPSSIQGIIADRNHFVHPTPRGFIANHNIENMIKPSKRFRKPRPTPPSRLEKDSTWKPVVLEQKNLKKQSFPGRNPKSIERNDANSYVGKDMKPIFQDPRSNPDEVRYYNALEDEIRKSSLLTESVRLVSSDSFRDLIAQSLKNKKKTNKQNTNITPKTVSLTNTYQEIKHKPISKINDKYNQLPFYETSTAAQMDLENTKLYSPKANKFVKKDELIDTMYNFKDFQSPMVKYSSREPWHERNIQNYVASQKFTSLTRRPRPRTDVPTKHHKSKMIVENIEKKPKKPESMFFDNLLLHDHFPPKKNDRNKGRISIVLNDRRNTGNHNLHKNPLFHLLNNIKENRRRDPPIKNNHSFKPSPRMPMFHNNNEKNKQTPDRSNHHPNKISLTDTITNNLFNDHVNDRIRRPARLTDYSSIFSEVNDNKWTNTRSHKMDHSAQDIIRGRQPTINIGVSSFYGTGNPPLSKSNHPFVFTSMPTFDYSSRAGAPIDMTANPSQNKDSRIRLPENPDSSLESSHTVKEQKSYIVPTISHKELSAAPSLLEAFFSLRKSKSEQQKLLTSMQESNNNKVPSLKHPPERESKRIESSNDNHKKSFTADPVFPKHGYNIDDFFEGFPSFGYFEKS